MGATKAIDTLQVGLQYHTGVAVSCHSWAVQLCGTRSDDASGQVDGDRC